MECSGFSIDKPPETKFLTSSVPQSNKSTVFSSGSKIKCKTSSFLTKASKNDKTKNKPPGSKVNIFFQNVQGLANKVLELDVELLNIGNPFIVCLSETWLTKQNVALVCLSNYSLLTSYCRTNFNRGGVAIFGRSGIIANEIDVKQFSIDQIFECCAVYVLQPSPMVVVCMYTANKSFLNQFLVQVDLLLTWLTNKHKCQIFVGGDINQNFLVKSQSKSDVVNEFLSFGFSHLIDSPTRVCCTTSTCIDQCFTNKVLDANAFVQQSSLSDHYAIVLSLPNLNKLHVKEIFLRRSFSECNIRNFINYLSSEDWTTVYSEPNFDDQFQNFLNTFRFYFDLCFPLKEKTVHSTNKTNKWITSGILKSRKTKLSLYKAQKNSSCPVLKAHYKTYVSVYKSVIRMAKIMSNNAEINSAKNKTKKGWQVLRKELGTNQKPCDHLFSSDDPSKLASDFNSYFCNIASELTSNLTGKGSLPKFNNNSFFFNPTSSDEIIQIVKKRPPKKASGPDEIPDFLVKQVIEYISEILSFLFNNSFSSGIFPSCLKVAKVLPLFKKGDRKKVDSYRPISNISIFSKILECLVKERLLSFFNFSNLFSSSQHGFLSGRSTNTAIAKFLENIYNLLDNNKKSSGLFLDLSKAFDVVDFDILLKKMYRLGFRGNTYNWFKSYLYGRSQYVFLESQIKSEISPGKVEFKKINSCSSKQDVVRGVPQGSILGPLLFLVFINDLDEKIPEDNLVLYCDDTNVIISGDDEETLEHNLISTCLSLEKWFNVNKLVINVEKSSIINFHSCQASSVLIPCAMNGTIVPYSQNIKFLGLLIDNKLNWRAHIDSLAGKLSSTLYMLRILKKSVSQAVLLMLYYANFQSQMLYGIIFWGYGHYSKKIFILQKKAMRVLAGKYRDERGFPITCKPFFKDFQILTFPALYILECVSFFVQYPQKVLSFDTIHDHNTRFKNNFCIPSHKTTLFEHNNVYMGSKLFNKLPTTIRVHTNDVKKFKKLTKEFLLNHVIYSVEDFLSL